MSEVDDVAGEFIERMGLITQADGLPRIAGRIIGFLVIHGGRFSFADLAQRLDVSRSSVSTDTRLLGILGAIERVSYPGDRQEYFRRRPDAYARVLERYIQQMEHACEMVGRAKAGLPQDQSGSQERLSDLLEFYRANIACTREDIGLMSKTTKKVTSEKNPDV